MFSDTSISECVLLYMYVNFKLRLLARPKE